MYIGKLHLMNYRNYSKIELDFHPKINIIVGENAQGKTNIIEAIYYLCIGKSHRSNRDGDLIHWNQENAFIKGNIVREKDHRIIEIGLSHGQKKIMKSNGVVLERVGELLEQTNIVLFSPEDLKLIKEGPIERRNFIDREISKLKPQYYYGILEYHRILQQRNHLLKKISENSTYKDTLPIWNEQLIEVGSKIILTRIYFLKRINAIAKKLHKEMTNQGEDMELFYHSNILSSQEDTKRIQECFRKKIEKNQNFDIQKGSTSMGPHRDDIKVNINDIDIRSFGSQGQQRTTALSLKLSILELIYSESGEHPILLLDDVMSELDPLRQERLIQTLGGVQTFITCTDLNFLKDIQRMPKTIFRIHDGGAKVESP